MPITGQGGNSALETAAALTNTLWHALQTTSSAPMPLATITNVFQTVQSLRLPRATELMRDAHRRQKLEAMDDAKLKAFAVERYPLLKTETLYREWTRTFTPAVSLNMLGIPDRPRSVPYQDELHTRGPKITGRPRL